MAKHSLTLETLRDELRSGTVRPLYLFHGEEDLLIDEAVRAVTDAAIPEHQREFNLDILRCGDADARQILGIASSFPMMAERRVVVARDADKLVSRDLELFTAYAENPSPSTALVLTGDKVDLRKNPFAAIRRSGFALECKRLYDNQVPGWIEARVRAGGKTIQPEASKMLAAYIGSSLRALDLEIEKIFTYLGETTAITADHVSAVVGLSREHSVFELQRAVGQRNAARALEVLEHMMDAGQNVPLLLVMLASYTTTLWKLQDLQARHVGQRELASEARVHPYFLNEYLEAVGRSSRTEIETWLILLADADERVKTGKGDHREIMCDLLVRMIGGDREHP